MRNNFENKKEKREFDLELLVFNNKKTINKKEKNGFHSQAIAPRQDLVSHKDKVIKEHLFKYLSLESKNKEENKKSLNQEETVQPEVFHNITSYSNLSFCLIESASDMRELASRSLMSLAQPGRAFASRANVQPDVRVQILDSEESPGGGTLTKIYNSKDTSLNEKLNNGKNSINKKIILLNLILFLLIISVAFAIPNSLTLQGKLTNTAGASISGTNNFTFRIYDTKKSVNNIVASD